jgi:hypothetical protein
MRSARPNLTVGRSDLSSTSPHGRRPDRRSPTPISSPVDPPILGAMAQRRHAIRTASRVDPTVPPTFTLRRRGMGQEGDRPSRGVRHPVTEQEARALVERCGGVLESARGRVPNLADEIAGEPIRGSWWGHRLGAEIFRLTRAVRRSPEIVTCRLIDGKVTYVHRRLWPALARVEGVLPAGRCDPSSKSTPNSAVTRYAVCVCPIAWRRR